MRKSNLLLTALSACLSLAMAACGGGGAPPGSSFKIVTQTSSPVQAWPSAAVSGQTDNSACSPSSSCITSIGNYDETGSIPTLITGSLSSKYPGVAYFTTTALPATWYFSAEDTAGDNTCPGGTSLQQDYGPSSPVAYLTCGVNPVGMATSPSSCTTTTVISSDSGLTRTSNCPTSVTLTAIAGSRQLPSASLIQVGNFDDSGNLIVQDTPAAVSATSLTVPVPTTAGTTYLILRNAANDDVIGIGEFTFNTITINQNNPCLGRPTCPIQQPNTN